MKTKDESVLVIKHTKNSKKGTTIAYGEAKDFKFGEMRETVQITVPAKRGAGKSEIIIPISVIEKMLSFGLKQQSKTKKQHGLFS
jgi:hypothetical protein